MFENSLVERWPGCGRATRNTGAGTQYSAPGMLAGHIGHGAKSTQGNAAPPPIGSATTWDFWICLHAGKV